MIAAIRRFFMRLAWMREYEHSLNERAEVEQILLDAARGVRPLPTAKECRRLAIKLGVPPKWRTPEKWS